MTDVQFTTREVPWMKLGKLADEPVTAEEAAVLGGLDFDVELAQAKYDWNGETREMASRFMTVRQDTGEALGVVSDIYEVVQFREAFAFMNTLNPKFVAAGLIGEGKQGFMVVKLPDMFQMLSDTDPHELYGVLRTSHNCSRSVEVAAMPLRLKCMNGLLSNTFTHNAPMRWSIRHTKSAHERMHEAQVTLGNLTRYGESYAQRAKQYMEIKVDDDEARTLLDKVVEQHLKSRTEVVETIVALSHSDETVNEFAGTAWGLINATSSYYQWERALGTPESRFLGMVQGPSFKAVNALTSQLRSRVVH